jgi:methyltransferase-like protein
MSRVYHDVNASTAQDVRVFYHEYLNVKTDTLYFSDFADRAKQTGLEYVDDALKSPGIVIDNDVYRELEDIAPDPLLREQLLDYFVNRSSRHSILSLDSGAPQDRAANRTLGEYFIATSLLPNPQGPTGQFIMNGKPVNVTHNPAHRQVITLLSSRWPGGLYYQDLVNDLSSRNGQSLSDSDRQSLTDFLYKCWQEGLVELRLAPPRCVGKVGDRPRASQLARSQATKSYYVTNQRHTNIPVGKPGRLLLPLLDGKNDIDSLTRHLGQKIDDASTKRVRQILGNLCRASLLID